MKRRAFTLIELLVAMAIIAILAVLVIQVSQSSIESGRNVACVSNLRAIGAAIGMYAGENENKIPYGPKAPPFTSPSDLYPSTGAPTSLISLKSGTPVALGLLLDRYLNKTPEVLFCPGAENKINARTELAKVGKSQAQGGYYYRHGGSTNLFDMPGVTTEPEHVRFGNLGDNRKGKPVRALVMDINFKCADELAQFNVKPQSNHHGKTTNVLFADGHVSSLSNEDGRFTIDASDYSELHASFEKIMTAFEAADEEP